MKRKIVALLTTAVISTTLIFTGCGGQKKSTTGGSEGKTLVYGQGADPRGLDPAYVDDGESSKVICNVYEGLLRYKKGSTELEPALATKWNVSDDGKEYTFDLRKDVKFHDGTPFNADAVVYNIERQIPPKVKKDMPYAGFTYGDVKKVEKLDDLKVKVTLKEASTPFLANLAMSLAAPMVSPTAAKKHDGNLNQNPVGTGPFKFVEWKKGQSITLERNEDYWDGKAKSAKVVFKFTKENSVRASELMTGSADIIDGIDPNDVKKLKDSKMKIFEEKGMNINYMAFNASRAPFNDSKLREAISYAINKPELVKHLYQGYADEAKAPMPDFIPGYNDKLTNHEYNPEKAKQLLKEAGKENMELKMITYSNPRPYNSVGGQKLAEAVQNYLAKIGVKAKIDVYPWKEYKTKVQQGEGDLLFYGWIGDNGDADNFLSLLDTKEIESSLNAAKYSNKEVDDLLSKARKTPNGKEREDLYKKVQEKVMADSAWYPVSHAKSMAAYSPKVKNFELHPTGNAYLKDVEKE
ncbi:ABC transporter substrate-binding protein [Clostridium oceanicum]|uniref:ABC transporter substrate-binding protein n=1 Tax=Clostridium oceanicum TaxID=1543 RepID=A0ABN1JUR0_9CLOT